MLIIKKNINLFIIVILLLIFGFFLPSNFTGKTINDCSLGCLQNNICIPIGTRTQDQYCDSDNSLKYQKSEEVDCVENYQCVTNICAQEQCRSYSALKQAYCFYREKLQYETEADCLAN